MADRQPSERNVMLRFKDLNTYASTTHYGCTNEETDILSTLVLERAPIGRAAGICSGGEVGFFVILPHIQDELVLVDHSYSSMSLAMLKWLILKEVGAEKAFELLARTKGINADVDNNHAELFELVEKLLPQLPAPVLDAYKKGTDYRKLVNKTARYKDGYYNNAGVFVQTANKKKFAHYVRNVEIAREWHRHKLDVLKAAEAKLDLVSFVHGDFTDLKRRKKFDLLYISNILGHVGRHGSPKLDELATLTHKDGCIVGTTDSYYPAPYTDKTAAVKEIKGRTSWNHFLLNFPEPAAA